MADGNSDAKKPVSTFKVTIPDRRKLHGGDKDKLLASVKKILTEGAKVKAEHTEMALGYLMHAFNMRSTSPDAEPIADDETVVELKNDQESVVIKGADVRRMLGLPILYRFKNRARAFARTFANDYVEFVKHNFEELPEIGRANDAGVPAAQSYLVADFIDTCGKLDNHEQAVKLRARIHTLGDKSTTSEPDITNLLQLGRTTLK